MQANAEREFAAARLGGFCGNLELLGDLGRRLAPGEIFVDGLGGNRHAGGRRASEIKRGMRMLHRQEQQLAVFDANVLAVIVDDLAGEHLLVDGEELARDDVARVVFEEHAVALVLHGITAGDDIDEEAAFGDAVEGGGHAGCNAGGEEAGPHGDEETQLPRGRDHGGGNHPGILAAPPGRQQHAVVAKLICSLCHLAQVAERDLPSAFGCAEIVAVAVRRQEPQDIGLLHWGNAHEPDLRVARALLIEAKTLPVKPCCRAMAFSNRQRGREHHL